MKEYRAAPIAAGDDMVLEGVAIVFDQPAVIRTEDGDTFTEVIHRHALDDCDLTDSRLLYGHDEKSIPFARAGRTMTFTVTDEGLAFRAVLDADNPRAHELYSAVKRGDLSGVSFGFTVDADRYDPVSRTRHIDAIRRVYEISICSYPAYQGTSVSAETREQVRQGNERMAALRLAGQVRALAVAKTLLT
jgi:HK97 family phage prohead protease